MSLKHAGDFPTAVNMAFRYTVSIVVQMFRECLGFKHSGSRGLDEFDGYLKISVLL